MAKKIKFLYIAYNYYTSITETYPFMTGCYNWFRVFDGKWDNWRDMDRTKEGLEKFDVVMVNMDWTDMRLVHEVREILGDSSSTLIVANQDHAPELWNKGIDFLPDFKNTMLTADRVWATSPTAQALMERVVDEEKKIWLFPHPCETHVLKRIRSVYESNHILVFWHRYDQFSVIPSIILKSLPIKKSLCGYMEGSDERARLTKCLPYDMLIPNINFPSFLKLIKEAKLGYDAFTSYSVGRVGWDCAALGTPMIGNIRNWSARICFPLTSFDPYDAKNIRRCVEKLLNDQNFYNEVKDIAAYNVEFAGHKNCREKFLEMLEGTGN